MKIDAISGLVNETSKRLTVERVAELENKVRGKKPPELVKPERMAMRRRRLQEADFRASTVDLERILGTNDLVDVNYLLRAWMAARAVCRVVLRSRAGREIGYGTGFKIAPHIVMTNEHVLEDAERAGSALVEFDYELDAGGRPRPTTRFELDPGALFLNDRGLDFAICAIRPQPVFGEGTLSSFGFLRAVQDVGKINEGEFMTIVQHPSGQPKQVALRENQLLSIEETMLWYKSDTAPGSSGSPVFNDSWQILAIHHSGVPRRNARGDWLLRDGSVAGPGADDGDIDWIANEGVRISRILAFIQQSAARSPHLDELMQAVSGALAPESMILPAPTPMDHTEAPRVQSINGGARITVPLSFDVRLADTPVVVASAGRAALATVSSPRSTDVATEKLAKPLVAPNLENRGGYDPDFLGVRVALPQVKDLAQVVRMPAGDHIIPYEHFSVVMDKERRLALFTASNVDASPAARRPEPNRDYSRKGLTGLGKNDREQWIVDERIGLREQLDDEFYEHDRQAFDKGHLVRRDDVCWGNDFAEVQRANGDTFHSTNCSPQVKDFNRSNLGGIWGALENLVLKQAKTERYCVFAGPLLRSKDRTFRGVDQLGEVSVKVPSAFWKIIVAQSNDGLEAFGFLLEQELTNVRFEFAVPEEWHASMISLRRLQARIQDLSFPQAVLDADQFGSATADEVVRSSGVEIIQEPPRNGGAHAIG